MTVTEELERLAALRASGTLTEAEFLALKARLIDGHQAPPVIAPPPIPQATPSVKMPKNPSRSARIFLLLTALVGVIFFMNWLSSAGAPAIGAKETGAVTQAQRDYALAAAKKSRTEAAAKTAKTSPVSTPKAQDAADKQTRLEECKLALIKAGLNGILKRVNPESAGSPTASIGPAFYASSFGAKETLAENLNCTFLGGESGKFINFELIDWRTNKRVARYSYGRLEMD